MATKYHFGVLWKTHRDGLVDLIRSLMHDLASVERGIEEAHLLIQEHRASALGVVAGGAVAHNALSQESPLTQSRGMDPPVDIAPADFPISRLARLVPTIGAFFTELDLKTAFAEYDQEYRMSLRAHVGPSFAEVRHILNLAQLNASIAGVRLITFDADGTLYDDGHNLEADSQLLEPILDLMRRGITVAIVTAAGYPKDAARYEERFRALLELFASLKVDEGMQSRFFVVGGECNYLFRVTPEYRLEWVDPNKEKWMLESFRVIEDREDDVQRFLDDAVSSIVRSAKVMGLDQKCRMIRKPRAIGYISQDPSYVPRREMLNELVFTAKEELRKWEDREAKHIPFCAFNSGKDVWVDVGHKAIAVESLQQWLNISPEETLHCGDQMDAVGNDIRARLSAPSLWVANPRETRNLLEKLLDARRPVTPDSKA